MSEAVDDHLDELLQRGFRYALSLVHHHAAAEDLLQEACVGISRRGGPWHRGYLFAAIRNAWIDAARRGGVATVTLSDADLCAEEVDLGTLDGEDTIEQMLHTLAPLEREALFLMVVEGHTAAEVAELVGVARGTVLSRVHRAKEKLRRSFSTDPTDPTNPTEVTP
ncbi:MAG: RNA polymerase sigma factor [Planctomycetota bacterium]